MMAALLRGLISGDISRRIPAGAWWFLVATVLLLLLWWRFDHALDAAHARGVAAERQRWTAATAAAQQKITENNARQQATVDTADRRATDRIAANQAVETHYVEKVRILYRDRADELCVDADGMRLIARADADRTAAATTASGGTGAM